MTNIIKKLPLIFISLLCLLLTQAAYAGVEVYSAKTELGDFYKKKLDSKLSGSWLTENNNSEKIVVTLGYQAYLEQRTRQDAILVAAFITYDQFYASPPLSKTAFAVFSDPPPLKIEQAIRDFLPNRTIGFFDLENELYLHSFSAYHEQLRPYRYVEGDLFRSFSGIYSSSPPGAFLISENREIYNKNSILFVLESLYRNRIPVISTNKALIGKGSTLTVYVPNDAIYQKLVELLERLNKKDSPPDKENFAEAEIVFDKKLADKLDIRGGGNL